MKKLTQSQFKDYVRDELHELLNESRHNWGERILNGDNTKMDKSQKGMAAAGSILALAATGGHLSDARSWAKAHFGADHVTTKALAAGDFTAGGAILPQPVSDEIIELLRNRTVVRRMNPTTVDLGVGGRLEIPKLTSSASASYIGENTEISKSEPEVGSIVLSAKKLAALVPISNDFIRFSNDAAIEMVRNDLVQLMATTEDSKFIRGDGTQNTPKGLRNWAAASNVTATNGTSASNVEQDFVDLMEDLEGNNVILRDAYWLMSSRSKNHLLNLRDANGNLIYPEIRQAQPTVHGWPVLVTNGIPNTLGGGTESEVYLVESSGVILGEVGGMELTTSSDGSYTESGSLVSAFSRDQTLVRAIMRHDLSVRHDVSVAVKTGVTWGV